MHFTEDVGGNFIGIDVFCPVMLFAYDRIVYKADKFVAIGKRSVKRFGNTCPKNRISPHFPVYIGSKAHIHYVYSILEEH